MNCSLQTALSASVGARKLRGNPPRPQAGLVVRRQFADVQRTEFQVCNSTGEALSGLPKQIQRGRAEQQELPRGFTTPDSLVDDASQRPEQFGGTVDLVQDH